MNKAKCRYQQPVHGHDQLPHRFVQCDLATGEPTATTAISRDSPEPWPAPLPCSCLHTAAIHTMFSLRPRCSSPSHGCMYQKWGRGWLRGQSSRQDTVYHHLLPSSPSLITRSNSRILEGSKREPLKGVAHGIKITHCVCKTSSWHRLNLFQREGTWAIASKGP